MKKKAYVIPIIVGFSLLYLFSMCLSTYFMTEHYQDQFDYEYTNVIFDLRERFSNAFDNMLAEVENRTDCYKNYMGLLISQMDRNLTSQDYQQYSVAIYDENGNKLAQSGNYVGFNVWDFSNYPEYTQKEFYFCLTDYLTQNQIKELTQYYLKISDNTNDMTERSYALNMGASIDKESGKLVALYLAESISKDETNAISEDALIDPVWSWESSAFAAHNHGSLYSSNTNVMKDSNLVFPYLYTGEAYYEKWCADEFLQGHPETREFEDGMSANQTTSSFTLHGETLGNFVFSNSSSTEDRHWIVLRSTSKPLLAAMDYLKYIYIISFLVMLACMLKVLYSAKKTYKEQLALEETRRSFTNMVARDLEIPLVKIQELTESLKANGQAQNQEEGFTQIIEQTEIMDEMIREMIQVSKQE